MKTKLLLVLFSLSLFAAKAQTPVGSPLNMTLNAPANLKNDGSLIYALYTPNPNQNIGRFDPSLAAPTLENISANQFQVNSGFELMANGNEVLACQSIIDEVLSIDLNNVPSNTTIDFFVNDARLIGETANNGVWIVYINRSNGQRELGSVDRSTGTVTPRGAFFGNVPADMQVDGDDLYVTLWDGPNNGLIYKVTTQNPSIPGPTPKQIVQQGITNPYGIDVTGNRVYFATLNTAGNSTIEWFPKNNPTATRTVFASGQPRLIGLTIIDQDIYVSDFDNNQILKFTDSSISPCLAIANITTTATNGTSANITWDANPDANDYEVIVVPSGQPLINGTPTIETSNSHMAMGLTPNIFYDAYVRSSCTVGGINEESAYTKLIFNSSGNPQTIFHVNPDAIGANNGISWADGFVDIPAALAAADGIADAEVWIKAGIYRQRTSVRPTVPQDRRTSLDITQSNIKVVGGFAGTETSKAQREFNLNKTVLTADTDLDDNGAVSLFSSSANDDNLYTVIKLSGDNVELDGLYVEGGRSNISSSSPTFATAFNRDGGGMYIYNDVSTTTIKNCTFQNNSANRGGGAIFKQSGAPNSFNITIENTTFRNNLARYGGGIYAYTNANKNALLQIYNSVFDKNRTEDLSNSTKGFGGSAVWIRALGANSTFDFQSINNTIVNNEDLGTEPNIARSPFGFSDDSGVMNAYVYNSLFFGNIATGGVTSNAIADMNNTGVTVAEVENSADELAFSNLPTNTTTVNNISSSGLFFDALNNDYTPSFGAAELNAGSNGLANNVNLTSDVLNNQRFDPVTSNVDIGAFENQKPNTQDYNVTINIIGDGTVSPLNGTFYAGDVINLVATPSTGFLFENYSGDVISTNPNETVTVISDLNITATFAGNSPAVYVKWDATGNNDGTSWADAFNDLQDGIDAATEFNRIWVAEGRYFAGTSRTDYFELNGNAKLYGGFNGTETSFEQRSLTGQKAIIDGDINGDDAAGKPTVGDNTRADNSHTLIYVNGGGTVLDGFILRNAYANATSGNLQANGGAIFKLESVTNMTVRHTIFEKNYAQRAGAMIHAWFNQTQNEMTLENNIFRDNVSNYGGMYLVLNIGNPGLDLEIHNNLFEGNEALDTDAMGFGGSSMWLRPIVSNSNINASITNNTFFGNVDKGTNAVLNNLSTIGVDVPQGSSFNGVFANTIFWDNVDGNGNQISVINTSLSNTTLGYTRVFNSTSNLGFNNIPVANRTNISNVDPLFADATNGNFTLQDGSTAINTGDNDLFTAISQRDLAGNTRIFNSIIDQGAYENQTLIQQFVLMTNIVGNGTVTPSTGTSFNSGDTANLTATPDTGWQFDGWSGDLTSTNATETLLMDADKIVTATFSQIQVDLTVSIVGNGTVTPATGTTFNSGDTANLSATPDTGWQFEGWSGDLTSTNATETLLMDADKTVTATFSQIQVDLTVSIVGNGTVTPATGTSFSSGDTANLTATPDTGWQFDGWSGDLTSTNATETLLMDADKTVTATFSQIQVDLTVSIVGNGTVTPASGTTFNSGDTANLAATPDAGWQFDGWSGDLTSTDATETLLMDADKTVTATFSEIDYTININIVQGNGSFNISPAGPYNIGDVVTITATADANWEFASFSGDVSSTVNPYTFIFGAQDYNIDLSFDSTLGTDTVDRFEVGIYPNPTTSSLMVETSSDLKIATVYNVLGQKVFSSNSKLIDVSSLNNGMYVIAIQTTDGKKALAKFIKK